MKFMILQSDSINKLEHAVESHLAEGWQLQGGVCVCYDHGETRSFIKLIYAQALFYTKEPK